jgi:activator of 2-hydroxyglutaryl-CoA dehydratase
MDVFEGRVVATGGVVAHHPAFVGLLGEHLRTEIIVPPHPQEMGAFGAALAAREGTGSVGPAPQEVAATVPAAERRS